VTVVLLTRQIELFPRLLPPYGVIDINLDNEKEAFYTNKTMMDFGNV
jgi:hypothetical protein